MSRADLVPWIVFALFFPSGCHNCERSKCAPVLVVTVHDANGFLATQNDGVTLMSERIWSPCSEGEACSFRLDLAGDYTVIAPGYKNIEIHVADEKDECGTPVSQQIDVTLAPIDEPSGSTSKRTLGASCS